MHQVVVAVAYLVHLGHHMEEVVAVALVHAGRHMEEVAVVVLAHVGRPAVHGGGDGGCDTVPVVLAVDGPRHPCKPCCYVGKLLLYY